ncbi:MAG: hypothetical protein K8S13_12410 [Desulfobacula sp.]|uniref:hypothetical protein n=1 Tax=Desulfobacula sp. TaxID=2593537 RepID=UPI0025C040C4|nr:hypothetical protein [Desulfobacula sp.]MCD4720640.1 hypothetical protein [Desulfobacula sp.]
MKYFPLKTVIFCLLFTPILYVVTLNVYQKYFNRHYLQKIENIFIGDTSNLLDGRVSIEEQIAENIYTFLETDWMVQYIGLDLKALVTTKKGKLIYPTFINADAFINSLNENNNFEIIAKQNFKILNDGLTVSAEINLNHGSRLANFILLIYFSAGLLIVLILYKVGSLKAAHDTKVKKALIDDLQKEEQVHKQILENLKKERQGLFENIKSLNAKYQKDKKKLKINEDEMFDEILSLEKQLNAFIELKQEKEEEINELKSTISKYERRKSSKSKRNEFDFTFKRFSVLYKNIVMNRKAISGLLSLNEDQQIKAEECILLLNQKPEKITIKRKVFSGKKHKTTCLEVLFAYNGRLYFKQNEKSKIEVLVVGTKNTQAKDMGFLHNS